MQLVLALFSVVSVSLDASAKWSIELKMVIRWMLNPL